MGQGRGRGLIESMREGGWGGRGRRVGRPGPGSQTQMMSFSVAPWQPEECLFRLSVEGGAEPQPRPAQPEEKAWRPKSSVCFSVKSDLNQRILRCFSFNKTEILN